MSTSFNKINLTVNSFFLSCCYPTKNTQIIIFCQCLSALRGREISVISIGWKKSILCFMTLKGIKTGLFEIVKSFIIISCPII